MGVRKEEESDRDYQRFVRELQLSEECAHEILDSKRRRRVIDWVLRVALEGEFGVEQEGINIEQEESGNGEGIDCEFRDQEGSGNREKEEDWDNEIELNLAWEGFENE